MILLRRMVADHRRSLLWWSVGICGAMAMIVGLYPSIEGQTGVEKLFDEMPAAVKALAGAHGGLSIISPVGYLHSRLFVLFLPLLLLIFGIGAGARAIGGAETDKTLELLLAHPVSRRRVALERYAALLAMVLGLAFLALASTTAVAAAVGIVGQVGVLHLAGAFAAATCLAVLFASLAFSTGCAVGKRATAVSIAAVIAVVGYLVHSLLALVPSLSWMRPLSPWNWYLSDVILLSGPTLLAIALPLGLSAVLVAAGVWRFENRDLL